VPGIIAAYEEHIRKLEEDRHLIRDQMASVGRPASDFSDTLRTALESLGNPGVPSVWKTAARSSNRPSPSASAMRGAKALEPPLCPFP
jgi:hypothetical protein